MGDRPFRVLPAVTPANEHFWRGGADGELRILRCDDCGQWIHPPQPRCPICLSRSVVPRATSGTGTVLTYTVNHQSWYPGLDPPYVVAIVELAEQQGLRLTTQLVDVDPAEVDLGMPVRVVFEERPDGDGTVWIPLFEPDPDASDGASPAPARPVVQDPASSALSAPRDRRRTRVRGERAAVISGVGQSQVGRRIDRDPLGLTLDACLAAIEHAGLTRDDIDGLATYPGNMDVPPGFSGVGIAEVQDALRLELDWYAGGLELPGQLGSVANAVAAVAAGLCDHVLCFRTVWEATAQGGGGRASVTPGGGGGSSFRANGFLQWTLPFGAPSAANWIAMMANLHFHTYGTTREQLAWIALNGRRNAEVNPAAIYRTPMTLDDYLDVRMISEPLCLYDCDVPADGSTAVVVSRADAAADMPRPPVQVEAVGTALRGRPSWDQFDDLTTMALRDAASMMWERTDLGVEDVDVAELYDGFSFIALCWLEALGFCAKGEGGAFVDGGGRIAREAAGRSGSVALNTNGGQLSAGRLHGYGFLHEACVQLWGEAEERQCTVPGGGRPRVAVAAAGGGPLATSMLLRRD